MYLTFWHVLNPRPKPQRISSFWWLLWPPAGDSRGFGADMQLKTCRWRPSCLSSCLHEMYARSVKNSARSLKARAMCRLHLLSPLLSHFYFHFYFYPFIYGCDCQAGRSFQNLSNYILWFHAWVYQLSLWFWGVWRDQRSAKQWDSGRRPKAATCANDGNSQWWGPLSRPLEFTIF